MHGLGQPRVGSKYMWDKTCVGGTLESIVDQATLLPNHKLVGNSNNEVVPWFNNHKSQATRVTASSTGIVDALVPSTNTREGSSLVAIDSGIGTHVESCSGATVPFEKLRAEVAGVAPNECSSYPDDNSVSESATFCKHTRQLTLDTCDNLQGFTSTSLGNTSSGKHCTAEDHDSVCHSKRQVLFLHGLA